MSASEPAAGDIHLSVVIPCYNESENVIHTAQQIEEAFAGQAWAYEIIFVNDGSKDDTPQVIQRLAAADPCIVYAGYTANTGRGKALRAGFAAARGKLVASTDADLSYGPDQILNLLRALQEHPEADFAIGSPYMPGGSTEGVPPMRLLISRLGNSVLRYMMSVKFHTFTGIFRCYRREAMRQLVLESDGKEIHLEILSKADALGLHGIEVPAVLRARKRGKSKFRFGKTAVKHIVYGMHEKPMLFFGLAGLLMLLISFGVMIYLFVLSAAGHAVAGRPLLLFTGFLSLIAVIIMSIGFIAIQNVALRREIYKLSSQTKQIADRLADKTTPPGESSGK